MDHKLVTNNQAVVFAILMQNGDGILTKAPIYIEEKAAAAFGSENPEGLLDGPNMEMYRQWQERWG